MPHRRAARRAVVLAAVVAAPASAANFSVSGRWYQSNALGVISENQGDPATLTWSIPPDGTTTWDTSQKSNLNAKLKSMAGSDYKENFDFIFRRMGEVSGLQFAKESDDGAALGTAGRENVRGDIRIVGRTNGVGGLAWAGAPPNGDIEMNTGWTGWSDGNIVNVVMHEVGHTIGIHHVTIYSGPDATEPYKSSTGSIMGLANGNGPQFDDLYAMHRMYGDRYERGSGNDGRSTATSLGDLTRSVKSLGTDINDLSVDKSEKDFVSIDDNSDTDYFRFTITERSSVTVTVTPKGPTYDFTPEGGSRRTFNAREQSDLEFAIYDGPGGRLKSVDAGGLGDTEKTTMVLHPGDYFVRVKGAADKNQFYRLDVDPDTYVVPTTTLAGNALVVSTGGLAEGHLAGSFNTSEPNPATAIRTTAPRVDSTDAGLFGDNSTWVYTARFTLDAPATWSFAENFDDSALLKIDGQTLLNNRGSGTPTYAGTSLAAGEHTIEIRVGQGGGEVGPSETSWAFGVGYDPAGGSNYQKFTDPGDGSRFYNDRTWEEPIKVTAASTIQTTGGGRVTFTGDISAAATLTFQAGAPAEVTSSLHGAGALVKTGPEPLVVSGPMALTGSVTVREGALIIDRAGNLTFPAGLAISAGAQVQLRGGAGAMSVIGGLQLDGGRLDLADNSLIVRSTPEECLGDFHRIAGQVRIARGTSSGPGIVGGPASALAGLAVVLNGDGGASLFERFNGIDLNPASILVVYTWNGDASLDGRITGEDYLLIDRGFLGMLEPIYRNGDFDYSGRIDADDYWLIDTSCLAQPGPLLPMAGSSAVPEPSAAGLLAMAGACLLRRRRI